MDVGEPADRDRWFDIRRLPKVDRLRVRRREFDPPRRVTSQGVDREVREAIEIEVRVSEPFTVRALGPVLWVGDEPLTVAESDRNDVYRFFAFDPEVLRPEAPISLSWGLGGPREEIPYRYSLPTK